MFRRVPVHICRVVIGCNASTRPRDPKRPLVNVYSTAIVRGCHSVSDIVMAAYAMLKRRDPRCFYDTVEGMQYISDQSDDETSHPIEWVPCLYGAAADREIFDVDLHTLEQKAVDGNTAFVVGWLVIDKVRTDVSFYLDDHGNLRCEKHACVNDNTCFLVRVCFVESATGRSIWLTLFDQCMASLLDVGAKDLSLMNQSMRMSKLNTLVGICVSLTIKKNKLNGYTNYNVTHLEVLH